jgi:hypothetical protein
LSDIRPAGAGRWCFRGEPTTSPDPFLLSLLAITRGLTPARRLAAGHRRRAMDEAAVYIDAWCRACGEHAFDKGSLTKPGGQRTGPALQAAQDFLRQATYPLAGSRLVAGYAVARIDRFVADMAALAGASPAHSAGTACLWPVLANTTTERRRPANPARQLGACAAALQTWFDARPRRTKPNGWPQAAPTRALA